MSSFWTWWDLDRCYQISRDHLSRDWIRQLDEQAWKSGDRSGVKIIIWESFPLRWNLKPWDLLEARKSMDETGRKPKGWDKGTPTFWGQRRWEKECGNQQVFPEVGSDGLHQPMPAKQRRVGAGSDQAGVMVEMAGRVSAVLEHQHSQAAPLSLSQSPQFRSK